MVVGLSPRRVTASRSRAIALPVPHDQISCLVSFLCMTRGVDSLSESPAYASSPPGLNPGISGVGGLHRMASYHLLPTQEILTVPSQRVVLEAFYP